jgi:hypothetical protein
MSFLLDLLISVLDIDETVGGEALDDEQPCFVYFTCADCLRNAERPVLARRDGTVEHLPLLCERCDARQCDQIAQRLLAQVWGELAE